MRNSLFNTLLALTLLLALTFRANAAERPWPYFELPKEVQTFDVGDQLSANGLSMRIQGFISSLTPNQLIARFRLNLGQPLVENILNQKTILGRAQGERYITVQLEPLGHGTRGMIAVSDLRTTIDRSNLNKEAGERMLARFPPGSQLINQTDSIDRGQSAHHTALRNTHSPELNIGRIKTMMRDDGFVLERETDDFSAEAAPLGKAARDSKILFFKGDRKEAIAMVFRDRDNRTAIVVNTITFSEQAR